MPQQTDLCTALETRLEIAEKVLSYSNYNIQLTMQICIGASQHTVDLLAKRVENSEKIATLIQQLREQVQPEEEKQLLDAASPHSRCMADYGELLHEMIDGRSCDIGAATANVIVPLLLDNASWKAFVEFLRAQRQVVGLTDETKSAMTLRMRELVRHNQILKSVVAERKRLEERLSQLASIIEFANDAIVICTLGGTIASWNRGAEAVYGYSAREVLGRSRYMLVPPDEPDGVPGILEKLKLQETIQPCRGVHIRKGGQRIGVSISVSPVMDVSGNMVGFAEITREI